MTIASESIDNLPQIKALKDEIEHLKNVQTKSVGQKRPWEWVIPSLLVVLGGAFTLGYYLGNNAFDGGKNTLYEENPKIKTQLNDLNEENEKLSIRNRLLEEGQSERRDSFNE